jgi:very-short-patch-repair endonuclease
LKRAKRKAKRSYLEETFLLHCRLHRVPTPERELRFAKPERQFRFDFAWPERKVAVECEGGIWSSGRHTRGSGFERDCDKYNLAVRLGWKVLRFTAGMIESGLAIQQTKELLECHSPLIA